VYKRQRNESSYITKVLEKLSDIYQISEEKIAEITTENSNDVFGI
jgi:TatD DNase family protein